MRAHGRGNSMTTVVGASCNQCGLVWPNAYDGAEHMQAHWSEVWATMSVRNGYSGFDGSAVERRRHQVTYLRPDLGEQTPDKVSRWVGWDDWTVSTGMATVDKERTKAANRRVRQAPIESWSETAERRRKDSIVSANSWRVPGVW